MTNIAAMTPGHEDWEETIRFAEGCSWRAGPYLAKEMKKGAFTGWERVFRARVDGEIAGFCTFTKTDELDERCGFFPFIGFVFVEEKHRGRRLSQKLIDAAVQYAGGVGFDKVYLMSGEQGLYEKYGFEKIGEYETIFGTVDQLFVKETARGL